MPVMRWNARRKTPLSSKPKLSRDRLDRKFAVLQQLECGRQSLLREVVTER